ncbi:Extracellular matrix-binding ebh, putative [Babesia ovata]|uniref:Extracellular matrix-binding ebh, putative n=1 Tax=Babesia ovata TaxID=189622 RepID=A0A2H6KB68_9APIC|nr:Extracellular matrix-binding ebh, putative [Babesia ovata]GBE60237.1 Extracellular matrix-binding ebh, putative [Babesia ovata]
MSQVSKALKAVEDNVTEALQAVVNMDKSLKGDLFNVKKKIKEGIESVLGPSGLNVLTLDQKVQTDLVALKVKIEDVTKDDPTTISLIQSQLKDLGTAKSELENKLTGPDPNSIKTLTDGRETNFKNQIKTPLNAKVSAVDSAIETLGGKFNSNGALKTFDEIFKHIKEKVAEIINGDKGDKGLNGIAKAVQQYATDVYKNMRESTINDWLPKILGDKDKPVKDPIKGWLEKCVGNPRHSNGSPTTEDELRKGIKHQIKDKLEKKVYDQVKEKHNVQAKGQVAEDLGGLKTFLEEYANTLDDQLKPASDSSDANPFVSGIVGQVGDPPSQNPNNQHLTFIVEAIFVAVAAKARRAGEEIGTLLLDAGRVGTNGNKTSIAKALDDALKVAAELDGQLNNATTTPRVQPESPAKAVDTKLKEVKDEVGGQNDDDNSITSRFKKDVKKSIDDAVKELPEAVKMFDAEAEHVADNAQ